MLLSDVGDQMCWWQARDVGDRFKMFVTDFIHWKIANIMILPPTFEISHDHDVTNITVTSLTSRFSFFFNSKIIIHEAVGEYWHFWKFIFVWFPYLSHFNLFCCTIIIAPPPSLSHLPHSRATSVSSEISPGRFYLDLSERN